MKAKYVLTATEMANVDRFAIQELGIPGAVLMEQAGNAVAKKCLKLMQGKADARIVVICGRGNNGGDGFVVARKLTDSYPDCQVFLLGDPALVKGDAKLNLEILQKLGHPVNPFGSRALQAIARADLIVDAMLGTGARGNLRDDFKKASRAINRSPAKVVSVDLPTGIDADTGECDPDAIRANATVTFGALKPGLLFSPGHDHAGEITVADIGFPKKAFDPIHSQTYLLDFPVAATLLPKRERTAFKNRCGQVYVIAGSRGMGGAAYLTSRATLRSGAGLVILGAPISLASQLEGRLIEVIKEPLAEENGALSGQAWKTIQARLSWADVIAIGPGLGTGKDAGAILYHLIEKFRGILVIDADGLNLLQGNAQRLQKRPQATIITPHPGEFSRLTGLDKKMIMREPVRVAREFAKTNGVHTLLKGAPSVAAAPSGEVFINSVGNPGMASAGMGDVLTGTIAGLAGQLKDAKAAMLLGMFAHSLAGDLAAKALGEIALTAGDVLESLPEAFQVMKGVRLDRRGI